MPEARLFTIFAYDISDDRKRRHVATILEEHAVRVQNSVFEAWMTRTETERLSDRLERMLESGDSLRVYVVSQNVLARCRTFGGPAISDNAGFLLV